MPHSLADPRPPPPEHSDHVLKLDEKCWEGKLYLLPVLGANGNEIGTGGTVIVI